MNGSEIALIALGSNLGNSVDIISRAFEELQLFSVEPLRRSSLWRSEPVDCPPGSPAFINAAASLKPRPSETPQSLLRKLRALEEKFGRQPKAVLNEPRPLDLDLIAFGARTALSAELTLPHPRAHLRRFVLLPLSEIAANFVLPGQGRTIQQLLEVLPRDESVRRL